MRISGFGYGRCFECVSVRLQCLHWCYRRETALGEVVLTLLEPNTTSCITLLDKLLARGTYGCGTIQTNRKNFPSKISEEAKKFESGGSVFLQCGKIVATAWKDNSGKCSKHTC